MKKVFVVRVVQTMNGLNRVNEGGYIDYAFIDSLSHAGVIDIHETDPHGLTCLCFDILPPAGVDDNVLTNDSETWADQTAKHMQSLGFNAVKAPRSW